jgi:hypothetical protein
MTELTVVAARSSGLRARLRTLRSDVQVLIALLSGSSKVQPGDAPPIRPAREVDGGWLGEARRSVRADCFLLALAIITVGVSVDATISVARLLLVLAAACLIPGAALLTRLSVDDPLEGFTVAVALSFSVEAAGAVVMLDVGWWHPFAWAIILLAGACVAFLVDLRRIVLTLRRVTPSPVTTA